LRKPRLFRSDIRFRAVLVILAEEWIEY